MAYLGKRLVGVLNESKAVDTMTGDGSDTTMTLSRTPGSVNNVEVYMDGVFQTPGVEYTLSGNTVSFSSAPENGTMIIALMGNDSSIIEPNDASISGTKIAGAVVTDAKIGGMAANKLSGALPAVDGSALTNLPSGVTKNASDPAIDTNPSGGVGTIWANTTSGEMYVLTDATAGSNIWTNVGGGTGDVSTYTHQGETYGWRIGGGSGGTKIDRYPFASQTNSTSIGDLLYNGNLSSQGGAKSKTHGYMVGADGVTKNTINKFAFSSGGSVTATDVGDLDTGVYGAGVAGNGDHIWSAGGYSTSITNPIQKLATASDGNATQTGTIGSNQYMTSGQSSETNGYIAGGLAGTYSPNTNKIHKWSFASDGNATQPMTLNTSRRNTSSNSSTTHGYSHGGYPGINVIEKFTFAADNNATDVGDLVVAGDYGNGSSSNTHGYCAGNRSAPQNTIERYSFSSDGNSVDWADLSYDDNSGGASAAS